MSKRYAFRKELGEIVQGSHLWVLADSNDPEENKTWLTRLCQDCSSAKIHWILSAGQKKLCGGFADASGVDIFLSRNETHIPVSDLAREMRKTETELHFLIGTLPYDSFSEWVKYYEPQVLELVKQTRAIYILHDKHYGVLKFGNKHALKERTRTRAYRLWLYKNAVALLLGLSRLFLREKSGWRHIKGKFSA